jgi:hypothetical protein
VRLPPTETERADISPHTQRRSLLQAIVEIDDGGVGSGPGRFLAVLMACLWALGRGQATR